MEEEGSLWRLGADGVWGSGSSCCKLILNDLVESSAFRQTRPLHRVHASVKGSKLSRGAWRKRVFKKKKAKKVGPLP